PKARTHLNPNVAHGWGCRAPRGSALAGRMVGRCRHFSKSDPRRATDHATRRTEHKELAHTMTTRISQDGPHSTVNVAPAASRVTPKPATPFKSMLQASTLAVLSGAEAAAHRLPGGEVLAAAVRPGATGAAPFVASSPMGGAPGVSTSPTDPTAAGGSAP